MKAEQAPKAQPESTQEPSFAAFVAIDWADQEHAWAIQQAGSRKREQGKLPHTPEAIEEWATKLAAQFPNAPIAVALEQSRGALLHALRKYPFLTIYPIHPRTSANYRSAMYPSGAKDDPKDAGLLLDLLVLHRDRLRPLRTDIATVRELQELVELRRQLVDGRTALTNQATAHLKLYFPQVLAWFDDLATPIVKDFLDAWPTLEQLQKAPLADMQQFFLSHRCQSESRNAKRLQQIAEAKPLTTDSALIGPHQMLVAVLLAQIAALRDGIQKFDQRIEQVFQPQEDAAIFASFPGAGPVMAPRLLAAFGSLRDRFASASEVQSFTGIAPVISSSGKTMWTHFRWASPKFVRQTIHEFAGLSIQQSEWAREFYDKQRAKGKGHHAAVRSLAFKWIRILFRCWQDRTTYQEELYSAALARRTPAPSAVLPTAGASEGILWKSVLGFSKISRPGA